MLAKIRSLSTRAGELAEAVRNPNDLGSPSALPRLLWAGLGGLARGALARWRATPRDRRLPLAAVVVSGAALVWLMPHGPLLAGCALLPIAVVCGRRAERGGAARAAEAAAEAEERAARLRVVYEALVPFFGAPEGCTADPAYTYGGRWEDVVSDHAFDGDRVTALCLRYPAHFPDGDAEARARVEEVLAAKTGRERELRMCWDREHNRLRLEVLPPLPDGVCAQRFVTGPGEAVLGFTDADAVDRTVPVAAGPHGEEVTDAAPVVWRTGSRAPAAHLLATGGPGSGTTSLLRSLALQALDDGDVLLVDGSGAGEFACFTGRRGVLTVESSPTGAAAALEWATVETERRLAELARARQAAVADHPCPLRPLWIVVDRPALLAHRARTAGVRDPQELLEVPLRHGRAAEVTVVVAEQLDGLASLGPAVTGCTEARVVLGPVPPALLHELLGGAPVSTPPPGATPGRGYARPAPGTLLRLQVPAAPDPYDDTTDERQRRAVLALLPERPGAPETGTPGTGTPGTAGEEQRAAGVR
ncbi:hypothetical protein [Streptomyces lonarensis]|uniref:hypothetical protein n=1 Tax=Streptomyces lonarensis TaxID=700599 RepID=UPI001ADDC9FD|nr:hypothetical protein [Streptomyces lonarensis]